MQAKSAVYTVSATKRRAVGCDQDEIENQRNRLIEELEEQLKQQVDEEELFFIEWEMK